MPETDATPAHASMRLHSMVDNHMHLVRPVEVCAVIHAAQLVVTADDEFVADESDQYPHATMDAVDLLRDKITDLVGEGE